MRLQHLSNLVTHVIVVRNDCFDDKNCPDGGGAPEIDAIIPTRCARPLKSRPPSLLPV